MLIIPDILEQNIDKVVEKIPQVKEVTDVVHIDIMDGIMVDNITVGMGQLFEIKDDLKGLKIDLHLMVEYPEDYLGDAHKLEVVRPIAQIEKMDVQENFINTAQKLGMLPCFALDLHTPFDAIEKELLPKLDAILIMSVKAGWSGQEFKADVLDKVKEIRESGYQGHIIMDGGMNAETVCQSYKAGADEFAVNSYFWNAEDKAKALEIKC